MSEPTDTLALAPDANDALPLRDRIELAVASVEPDVPLDVLLHADLLLSSIEKWARDTRKALTARQVEWMERNGNYTNGPERVLLAHPKKTTCVDERQVVEEYAAMCTSMNPETGEEVFDKAKFLGLLFDTIASEGFKPTAAIKELSPEAGKRLFVTTYDGKVKREGGPKAERDEKPATADGRTIQRINTEFVK